MVRGEINGLLMVCNKKGAGGFTPADQRLISILASQAAQVLESERLRAQERVMLDYREELHVASRIQCELLPKHPPNLAGYDVCSLNVPARMVGGDYFDFLHLGGARHVVCIGDVSGKGLPAALLMANLQAIVRTQSMAEPPGRECLARCQRFFDEPARQCVERCNRLIQRCTPPERFVTLFYGILDTDRHSLLFTNAGHNPPLLCRKGEVQRLRKGGIPLGIEAEWSYGQESVEIDPGDLIVLYSDGITEARDLEGEEFGEERILSAVRSHCSGGTEEMLESLYGSVKAHVAEAPQLDDMTLILLRRHSLDRSAEKTN
jgi:sigma-B regulation protein RsbU (phosphoserine phosphatase)